jgi:hypothetical protein
MAHAARTVAMMLSLHIATAAVAEEPAPAFLTIAAFNAHQQICDGITARFSAADRDALVAVMMRLGLDVDAPAHASIIDGYVVRLKDGISEGGLPVWCKTIRSEIANLIFAASAR